MKKLKLKFVFYDSTLRQRGFENGTFYTLKNDLKKMINQPITSENKFDFNIFPIEDELRNLPPSHDIILN